MSQIGFRYPEEPRKTALYGAEDWYQNFLAEKLGKEYQPIKRSDFGRYAMAVNYLTSVMEESKAIEKVAVFNIDHMVQLRIHGNDADALMNRVLPIEVNGVKVGQCKYTLLLTSNGTVLDDLILMKVSDSDYILVLNAGHDITDKVNQGNQVTEIISDADYIASFQQPDENVEIEDISQDLVKIDVQGPLSYKLISELYGKEVLRNRNKPNKNMSFFTFNETEIDGHICYLSRTGYTNRWGWEMYFPAVIAEENFKKIVTKAYDLGGLLVGLGGRDENRISAGAFGLPLYGHEYDAKHTPTNAPLFNAAVEMHKKEFIGKKALQKDINDNIDKRMVLFIAEGIATGRGIYKDGERLGSVTSSMNSPNVPYQKRLFIESGRKNVNQQDGNAAIGLGWLYHNPFDLDEDGNDILVIDGEAVRIPVEFYRENEDKEPAGKPIKGYIAGDGVNPATAPKPLKKIESL